MTLTAVAPAFYAYRWRVYEAVVQAGYRGLTKDEVWALITQFPEEAFEYEDDLTPQEMLDTLRWEGPLRVDYDQMGQLRYYA